MRDNYILIHLFINRNYTSMIWLYQVIGIYKIMRTI